MALHRTSRVAVLALQGDFDKHIEAVERLGATSVAARLPEDIDCADALIIPGGESTTMTKMMARYGLDTAVRSAHNLGKPIYGTCAGMIVLAGRIDESTAERNGQTSLGIVDITVARNAYGRQINSFEEELSIPSIGPNLFRAVFIRAPKITKIGKKIEVLATHNGVPVFVRQGNVLVSSFHPELSNDDRIHAMFLKLITGD